MLDYDIREALCGFIDERYEKVRIIDELVIGRARADIVTVTDDCLTGYEIKGDTDSYTRLPVQVKEYDGYFSQNYLVVGVTHRKSAAAHVPPHWGLLCVGEQAGGVTVELLREPSQNTKFSMKKQMRLLWRGELAGLLRINGFPKYAGKSKAYLCAYLRERVPQDKLQAQICAELFERDWTLF